MIVPINPLETTRLSYLAKRLIFKEPHGKISIIKGDFILCRQKETGKIGYYDIITQSFTEYNPEDTSLNHNDISCNYPKISYVVR